jgi:hypothetical protein
MAIFDYAPAPESVRPQIREDYGLFIDGRWTRPESGAFFETVNPANETPLARVAQANAADVDRAVRAARKAYDKYWRKLKSADRAKYIYRIARGITERSRELAVLETMDGGKPIKESRDFDIPQSAAHFFYHAGWADKLEWVMRAGREAQSLGCLRPDRAVELSAAHGGVEARAGPCLRQYGRAQTGRDDAAYRARACANHRRGRSSAWRRQRRNRRRNDRSRTGRASRRR